MIDIGFLKFTVLLCLSVFNCIDTQGQNSSNDKKKDKTQVQTKPPVSISDSYPIIDKRDNKRYKTIKVSKQIWMAQNLAYKTKIGSWAYENNELVVEKHGYLYDWETAQRACPDGWRLPKRSDFKLLLYYMAKLSNRPSKELVLGGCSGFNALQSGWRGETGDFYEIEISGNYWTQSRSISGRSWLLYVGKKGRRSYLDFAPQQLGMSVRCIKE